MFAQVHRSTVIPLESVYEVGGAVFAVLGLLISLRMRRAASGGAGGARGVGDGVGGAPATAIATRKQLLLSARRARTMATTLSSLPGQLFFSPLTFGTTLLVMIGHALYAKTYQFSPMF